MNRMESCCVAASIASVFLAGTADAEPETPPKDPQRYDVRYQKPNEATVILSQEVPATDGEYDELWQRIHIYPLTRIITGSSDEVAGSAEENRDLIGGFQILHDGERLYLFVRVIDDKPRHEGSVYDTVILDFGPEGAPPNYIFRISGKGVEQPPGQNLPVEAAIGPPPVRGDPGWPAHSGYTAEFSVSLDALGLNGRPGEAFGINVHIADVDDGRRVETVWRWASAIIPGGATHGPLGRAVLADAFTAGSYSGFMPAQVWLEQDGVVVIDAEDVDHHSNWVFKTTPDGYAGTGYLSWQGADRTLPAPPFLRRGNDEFSNERLGSQCEWLILRVSIETPGKYGIDVRNVHFFEDGDNDIWFGELGQAFGPSAPITRMGDNLKSGKGFSWLDWGAREVELEAGEHAFFIGGRSVNFGVDRIAFYRKEDPDSRGAALDPTAQVSRHTRVAASIDKCAP